MDQDQPKPEPKKVIETNSNFHTADQILQAVKELQEKHQVDWNTALRVVIMTLNYHTGNPVEWPEL